MPVDRVSQNVTELPAAVSPYLQEIIDNKVAGFALTCFQAIVHWLLTTCSCFYPAYNRFYEHQSKIASISNAETAPPQENHSATIQQRTSMTAEQIFEGESQEDPNLLSESLNRSSSETTIPAQQPSQEPPVTELQNLQPLNLNLLLAGDGPAIIAEPWKAESLYALADKYRTLTPFLAKPCLEIIRTKLTTSGLMQVVATLELALSPPDCTTLSDLVKDELVQRLDGQNPFEGDAESKQAAQKKLIDLLVGEIDVYTAAIPLHMWESLPSKFEAYSFRSAALLEILNTKVEQGSLKELEAVLSTITSFELHGPTVPPALEATPINKMRHRFEQLLSERSLDQEINELELATPPESQAQEIIELAWTALDYTVHAFYFNSDPTKAPTYQQAILAKLPYADLLLLLEVLEESVLTTHPFGAEPKASKVEFLNNALKGELCFRSGKDLFEIDGLSARTQLYEMLRLAIQKCYNSEIMFAWPGISYKFQPHSFRSAAMLEGACELEQDLEQLTQMVAMITEADTNGALNPMSSFLPLEAAPLNKIKAKIAALSDGVDPS